MKVFAYSLLLASLAGKVSGDCTNDLPEPKGFGGEETFEYPREADCVPIFPFVVCDSLDDDENIEFDDGNGNVYKLTINDFYQGSEATFMSACEELWACTDYSRQYSEKVSGETLGDKRELCFGEPYPITGSGDEDRFKAKKNFILTTCHGIEPDGDLDAAARVDRLELARDTTCAVAEDYARRATFTLDLPDLVDDLFSAIATLGDDAEAYLCNPNIANQDAVVGDCAENAVLCKAIAECIKDNMAVLFADGIQIPAGNLGSLSTAGVNLPLDIDSVLTPSSVYDICWNVNNEDLLEQEAAICGTVACGLASSYNWEKGPGGCETKPVCPANIAQFYQDFGPAYPTEENGDYNTLVASIKLTFFPEYPATNTAPEVYYDRTCADSYAIVAIIKATFESLLVAAELLKDSLPDEWYWAWKVAPYVALNLIINSLDTVLAQADYHDGLIDGAEIEAVYENTRQLMDGSAAIYDEVVCRCVDGLETDDQGKILKPVRRGMGCNSQDDNCDQSVDDCKEDNWLPEFDIRTTLAVCSGWFQTQEDAQECVESTATVTDDCDDSVTFNVIEVKSDCGDSTITIQATDRCENTAVVIVPVKIDESAPETVQCFFGDATSNDDSIIFIEQDVGLWEQTNLGYTVQDGCSQDVNVTVTVFSHEEYAYRAANMAIFYQDTSLTGGSEDKAALQVAADVCNKNQNSETNPHNDFGQCIKDPNIDNRIRLYTIGVEATDLAGNSKDTECTILIKPRAYENITLDDLVPDPSVLQRFVITEYKSSFNDKPLP